jgi:hypothetical protein
MDRAETGEAFQNDGLLVMVVVVVVEVVGSFLFLLEE